MYFITKQLLVTLFVAETMIAASLRILKTDLRNNSLDRTITANSDIIEWFVNFSQNTGNTHIGGLYEDDDVLYLYPKRHELDLRVTRSDEMAYSQLTDLPPKVVFSRNERLIDVGVYYDKYVLFDTNLTNSTFAEDLLAAARESIMEERELSEHRRTHYSLDVRKAVAVYVDNVGSGDRAAIIKRDRNDNCNHPQAYESGIGALAQDRQLGEQTRLDGAITGEAKCGRKGNDQLVDRYSMYKLNVCHSVSKVPVAYSMVYYAFSCCQHTMGMWEHHGCRKGRRVDFQVKPGTRDWIRTNTYSWTVVS